MSNFESQKTLSGKAARGQSLVEFALMGTFLIMVLAGIVDLGRAYFTFLALRDASAEGAYYAQKNPAAWCGALTEPACAAQSTYLKANPDNIVYRIRNSSPSGGIVSWSAASISIVAPTIAPGSNITVTVSYPYQFITPFIGTIAGSQTITLRATTVAVIVTPP